MLFPWRFRGHGMLTRNLWQPPRLIIGHVYKHLKQEMKLLWTKDLRINTVHVDDVVSALYKLCEYYKDKPANGEIYNLADKQDSGALQSKVGYAETALMLSLDQETINAHIRSIFGIETGFQGTIISNFAKVPATFTCLCFSSSAIDQSML